MSGGAGCEVLRRRERPFLLFDDDGRVRPILYWYPVSSQSQNQSYQATFASIKCMSVRCVQVYLYTSASPSNTSLYSYAHVQQVNLPPGVGGPPGWRGRAQG